MNLNKVTLVFPPYPIPKIFPKRVQIPLGVAYLAGALREKGYDVFPLDSIVEGWEHSQMIGKKYIQYGMSLKDTARKILEMQPDVVGMSCMFGIQLKNAVHIARMVKSKRHDMPVIFGGAHASSMPREILKISKAVDYILLGEGEASFVELMDVLNGKSGKKIQDIDGIAYRDGSGNIIVNEKTEYIKDLDALPYPARDLFPMEKYFEINRPHGTISRYERSTSIVTSRGCPAKCVFCAIHSVWGRGFRTRSPENVVDEIEHLNKKYDIREFQIEDDNMTFDADRAEKICDIIIERKLDIHFTTPNGVAIWALNEQLLKKMKQAGFYRLTLAVESGSEYTLNKIIRKPLKLSKVKEIVDIAKRLGFEIDTFYVIGFPGESPAEMKKTFKLARKLNVDSAKFFMATPYSGTDLYEQADKDGMLIHKFDLNDLDVTPTKASMNTEYYSAKELERIWMIETMKTQFAVFLKRPVSYTKNIFMEYFKKDIVRLTQALPGILKKLTSKKAIKN